VAKGQAGSDFTTEKLRHGEGPRGGPKRRRPESLSEKTIPEPGINNLQARDHLQVVDSSLTKIFLRQAPDLTLLFLKRSAQPDLRNRRLLARYRFSALRSRSRFRAKADLFSRFHVWFHQFSNGVEDLLDGMIVGVQLAFQF
jgi:hypothetical protein